MTQIRGAASNNNTPRRLKKLTESCTGLIGEVQYEGGDGDDYLACETPSGMIYKVSSADKNFIKANFRNGKFKSGNTDLIFDEDVMIDEDTAELVTTKNPTLKEKTSKERKLAIVEGQRSVLVVRVVATDGSTGFSEAQLSDSVFGNGADGSPDPVNLKSQYKACSHNKLDFVESTYSGITNGATTVTVQVSTTEGDGVMRNAITEALKTKFSVSSPTTLANHVMYCLPPNTMSGIAYAYINSWNSVYSNQWCTYVSGQMHEIGHNLNLA